MADYGKTLSHLTIKGYKSIQNCEMELKNINILIGANGAGKSNFIGFFRFINQILDEKLQITVGSAGGADALLHFGRKETEVLEGGLRFGNNGYDFKLQATENNRMIFQKENLWWNMKGEFHPCYGHDETDFKERGRHGQVWEYSIPIIRNWRVYHFHDTSSSAKVKQIHNIHDNEYLREDARNLAAFLFRIKKEYEWHYKQIIKIIRLVAPFFGDFHLRPTPNNKDKIQLEWTEKNHDEPFTANVLSDGTLRFICLVTALLQPEDLAKPATILIDEPELGLHPYAINVLAGLIRSVSHDNQIIISTQSVELINLFTVDDIIVVDKHHGASTFKRPNCETLQAWLDDYSLGELWNKNLLGGRPK